MRFLFNENIPEEIREMKIAGFSSNKSRSKMQSLFICENDNIDIRNLLHNNKSSLRTLQLALDNIKDGYQFDDDVADKKISSIEHAVNSLNSSLFFYNDLLTQLIKSEN
jgi:HPt (histidine-containing phosphotransfer) domain-containing protein